MAFTRIITLCTASIALLGAVNAHGGGSTHQKPIAVAHDANWQTKHMASEHHLSAFDVESFFTLHDFNGDHAWDTAEILKFYGMDDPSAKDVTQHKKDEMVKEVLRLMDVDGDGKVERDEWMVFSGRGEVLPDFGTGVGHHWDMETEYEIHHWEKYHDENTKEEDLNHPEDIEHFRQHDLLEDEAARQAEEDRMPIVEHNIPKQFWRV